MRYETTHNATSMLLLRQAPCVRFRSTSLSRSVSASGGGAPWTLTSATRCHSFDTKTKHLSIAIVGSGPSGMYSAKYLHQALTKPKYAALVPSHSIDIIEKLPTPFGLVRSGVAPDHPEVKNVENDFSELFEQQQRQQQQQRGDDPIAFVGNVQVGKDISLSELRSMYDVVILAYGCESDRKLGLPGEDLSGVLTARQFVGWYNGHPDYVQLTETLATTLSNPEDAQVAVIGHGNVALDCARVLAKGRRGLESTDIAEQALAVLRDGVRKVNIVGRRGHVQGAFTIKECRELTKLKGEGIDVSFRVSKEELDMGMTEASVEELNGPMARPKGRIDKLLRQQAEAALKDIDLASSRGREISLRFLMNPVEFLPSETNPGFVGAVVCERTKLEGEAGRQHAVGTGEFETLPAQLALLSIGYKGVALPGLDDEVFNDRSGIIKNQGGKISDALYCSGWIKRGPSGIIGTNIGDAKETVSVILSDIEDNLLTRDRSDSSCRGRKALEALLKERESCHVDWAAYKQIDNAERDPSRLRNKAQTKEKFVSVKDMLSVIQ